MMDLWFSLLLELYTVSNVLFGMGGFGPVLLIPIALPIGEIQYRSTRNLIARMTAASGMG